MRQSLAGNIDCYNAYIISVCVCTRRKVKISNPMPISTCRRVRVHSSGHAHDWRVGDDNDDLSTSRENNNIYYYQHRGGEHRTEKKNNKTTDVRKRVEITRVRSFFARPTPLAPVGSPSQVHTARRTSYFPSGSALMTPRDPTSENSRIL